MTQAERARKELYALSAERVIRAWLEGPARLRPDCGDSSDEERKLTERLALALGELQEAYGMSTPPNPDRKIGVVYVECGD